MRNEITQGDAKTNMKRPSLDEIAIDQVAMEFCRILKRWLTPEQMRVVIYRNRKFAKLGDTGVCATHDFCDPNQAMLDAFKKFGVEAASQEFMENHDALWSDAWALAKMAEFDAARVPVVYENLLAYFPQLL